MTQFQARLLYALAVITLGAMLVSSIASLLPSQGRTMPLPDLDFAAIARLQGSDGTYGVVGWVSPTPAPTATQTPAPTDTPVIIATPAPAIIPTDAPTPEPTQTPAPVVVYVYPTEVDTPTAEPTPTLAPAWEFVAVSMAYHTEVNYPAIRASITENGNPAPGRWLVVFKDGIEVGRAESVNVMAQAGTGTVWTDDDYLYNVEVKWYEYNPQTWVGVWAVELRNGANVPVGESTVFTLQQEQQEVEIAYVKQ